MVEALKEIRDIRWMLLDMHRTKRIHSDDYIKLRNDLLYLKTILKADYLIMELTNKYKL